MLFSVALTACLGQQLKCSQWKQRHVVTDVPLMCSLLAFQMTPMNTTKRQRKEPLKCEQTQTEDLYAYTEPGKVYIREHCISPVKLSCRRAPSSSEVLSISFQRNFPVDNWSADWTLHIPPRRFCSKACCGGNDNTSCDRNCKLNTMWLLNAATLKTAFLFMSQWQYVRALSWFFMLCDSKAL